MTPQETTRSRSPWDRWYRHALPAYWIFLFSLTHFPAPQLPVRVRWADKLTHMACFGLLAFLFWRFGETFRRPVSDRFVWLALFWMGAYAALDEWSQSFVGRGADVVDWVADMLGAALVLAVLEWRRRRLRSANQTLDSLETRR